MILLATPGVTIYQVEGRTLLHTDEPLTCPHCLATHYFWRNLYGQTVCVGCVTEIEQEWADRLSKAAAS